LDHVLIAKSSGQPSVSAAMKNGTPWANRSVSGPVDAAIRA
jgi:hypothetical protein